MNKAVAPANTVCNKHHGVLCGHVRAIRQCNKPITVQASTIKFKLPHNTGKRARQRNMRGLWQLREVLGVQGGLCRLPHRAKTGPRRPGDARRGCVPETAQCSHLLLRPDPYTRPKTVAWRHCPVPWQGQVAATLGPLRLEKGVAGKRRCVLNMQCTLSPWVRQLVFECSARDTGRSAGS